MLFGKKCIGTVSYMGGVMSVPEPFVWSWGNMIQYNTEYLCQPGEIVWYDHATVSYHSYARNRLVERMQGDWLLMLDTDHQFSPDICTRMVSVMEKYKIDVLAGLYLYRSEPNIPVAYLWNKEGTGFEPVAKWKGNARLYQVGSAGAGCLLVKRQVFRRIRDELKEEPFDITMPFSEDHSFFNRLKKLNIRAYIDPKIEYPHLSYKPLNLDEYQKKDIQLSKFRKIEGLK